MLLEESLSLAGIRWMFCLLFCFLFFFLKDKLYFYVDLSEGLPIKCCTFLIVFVPVDATADWLGCSSVARKGILKLMYVLFSHPFF